MSPVHRVSALTVARLSCAVLLAATSPAAAVLIGMAVAMVVLSMVRLHGMEFRQKA